MCRSFEYDGVTGGERSYLIADPGITCNAGGEWNSAAFDELQPYFWGLFVLWPVLVPLAFGALLLWIRPSVRSQRVSRLALACSFLWRDYDPAFLFWEVSPRALSSATPLKKFAHLPC
jgi:hypothetical protein